LKEIEDEIEAMVLTTRERSSDATALSSETKKQFDILQQKLMEFEYERDAWQKRLHAYMMREEQMRKVIQENQLQINQLRQQQYNYHYTPEMRTSKSDNTSNSRHNSYLTASTRSSAYSDDDYYDDIEDDEEEENQQEREVIVDADDEDDDDGETDGRRRDLISPSYYDRRQYSLPAYYSTPSNNAYPYYPQTWKNYYYDAYYSGGYR
jgi:hypothetical protein